MVHVVYSRTPNAETHSPFEFKVYRSPMDGKKVLGCLVPYCVINGQKAIWIKTDWGTPVASAYEQVLKLAQAYGVSTVWVNDPDRLFPEQAGDADSGN